MQITGFCIEVMHFTDTVRTAKSRVLYFKPLFPHSLSYLPYQKDERTHPVNLLIKRYPPPLPFRNTISLSAPINDTTLPSPPTLVSPVTPWHGSGRSVRSRAPATGARIAVHRVTTPCVGVSNKPHVTSTVNVQTTDTPK